MTLKPKATAIVYLVKVTDSEKRGRQANADVEITPEMIEAGEKLRLFREFAGETIINIQRLSEEVELVLKRAKEFYREIDEQGADDLAEGR